MGFILSVWVGREERVGFHRPSPQILQLLRLKKQTHCSQQSKWVKKSPATGCSLYLVRCVQSPQGILTLGRWYLLTPPGCHHPATCISDGHPASSQKPPPCRPLFQELGSDRLGPSPDNPVVGGSLENGSCVRAGEPRSDPGERSLTRSSPSLRPARSRGGSVAGASPTLLLGCQ